MEKVENKLSFDLLLPAERHTVRVHSGEGNARRIVCSFRMGEEGYSLKNVASATLRAKTPSGAYIYNDCEIEENLLTVPLSSSITAESGVAVCQINLSDENGSPIFSPIFDLEILPIVYSDDIIRASDDFSALKADADRAEAMAEAAEMHSERAEEIRLQLLNAAQSAKEILTMPPTLISSGVLSEEKYDFSVSLGGKVYGDITVYLTIPPSGGETNWGFYTYFDENWVLHTDRNSLNSTMSGILTDKNSFVRMNARFDGVHWVLSSGNYFSSLADSGWTANTTTVSKGKNAAVENSYIERVRFVTDYNPSYGNGVMQIPFPKGTAWEIYGRREPEIAFLDTFAERTPSLIGTYTENVIDTDKMQGVPLCLRDKILIYIENGYDLSGEILINGKILASLSNMGRNTLVKLFWLGADFDTEITDENGSKKLIKTEFFGGERPIIRNIEFTGLSEEAKITLYGLRW